MIYVEDFISERTSTLTFMALWNELAWIRHSDAPRREYWTNTLDRPYTYGRGAGIRTYDAQPKRGEVELIQILIRDKLVSLGLAPDDGQFNYFEGCFLNGYEGARDWLGWHEDDDPGIDHDKPIAIVSLYSDPTKKPRSIQFRERIGDGFNEVVDLPLAHGSLCIMPAGFQFTHQHRIPKAGFDCADRISLTYRGLI